MYEPFGATYIAPIILAGFLLHPLPCNNTSHTQIKNGKLLETATGLCRCGQATQFTMRTRSTVQCLCWRRKKKCFLVFRWINFMRIAFNFNNRLLHHIRFSNVFFPITHPVQATCTEFHTFKIFPFVKRKNVLQIQAWLALRCIKKLILHYYLTATE